MPAPESVRRWVTAAAPRMLPRASATTTLRRTVPLRQWNKPPGILVRKLKRCTWRRHDVVGRDGRADGDATVLGDLGSVGGREAQGAKVVMSRQLQPGEPSAHVPRVCFVEVIHAGMMHLLVVPNTLPTLRCDRAARRLRRRAGQHDAYFGSRRPTLLVPGFSLRANSSVTSSVMGMGQKVPPARRMLWQTPS